MSKRFVISGQQVLSGTYRLQGSKNAALALISASLLNRSVTHLHRVPRIADVECLLLLLQSLRVKTHWRDHTLVLDSRNLQAGDLPPELVRRLRGSILLLGSIAPLYDRLTCALPGGCPIGRRSFDVHWNVFRAAGFSVTQDQKKFELRKEEDVKEPSVYLEESSVTATENALLLFSALGRGTIENPAREPHVLSLIEFLTQLGCQIEMHPLYYRVLGGVAPQPAETEYHVPGDYIDAGTVAIAAAATGGQVELQGIRRKDFAPIQHVLSRFGLQFEKTALDGLCVSAEKLTNPSKVTTGLWPSFPTDLVSLAIVLATQGKGLCLIQDWMYEGRMFFVDKLSRMGAHITMCDPHRVLVEGPSRLRGTRLESPDIRAGMALVVAGLCADEVTVIEHAEVIQRGYEDVAGRLSSIGATICEE